MRTSFVLFTTVLMVFAALGAHAQCAFDAPAKAKGLKSAMVRAYSACPGVTFAAPNTSTMAGVPACGPPTPMSTYQFGAKGKCSLRTNARLQTPCFNGVPGDCMSYSLKVRCSDVLTPDGVAIEASDGGWALQMVGRMTAEHPSRGDMTQIDFPVQFALDLASKGRLKGNFNMNNLGDVWFCIDCTLPACVSLEIVSIGIADPSGETFASLGSSTR